jgi:hypothetical protein
VESSGNVPVNRRSGVVSPDGRLANSGACSPGCTSDTLRLSCRSHASMASARSIPSLEPAPKGHSDRIAFHIILDRAAARGEWTLLSARRHHGAGSESGSLSCSVKILDFERWRHNCAIGVSDLCMLDVENNHGICAGRDSSLDYAYFGFQLPLGRPKASRDYLNIDWFVTSGTILQAVADVLITQVKLVGGTHPRRLRSTCSLDAKAPMACLIALI